jgi:RHS repeat-associated protein
VTASGAASYQWQSFDGTNWNDIAGATSSSVAVTPNSATQYRVIVTNAAASTTSNSATVTPAGTAIEPTSGIIYGDVNHDGVIDASDVTLLRAVLAGKQPLTIPTAVADLNGDGSVDALDLSLLAAYATHTITCLPQFATTNASSLSRVTALNVRTIIATQIAANPTQYFFYTPEKQLLSQTELKAAGSQPQIAIDYIWFNGHPVAEERLASPTTRYTFTDHLGTPFLQTDTTGAPLWRTESEPFGTTYQTRTGTAADQRLRFPGQEYDDQTPEREYNIFRWHREGWGRYTQADPIGIPGKEFVYASDNPILNTDVLGLRDTSDLLRRPITRLVCETAGEGAGWVAGRALGLITILLSSGGDLNPADFEASRNCDKCTKGPKCRPCIPPVGTLAFREDTNPSSPPHRGVPPPHWHLYEMHQSPPQAGCVCFWHPIPDNRGGFGGSPPPTGTVPITPAAGGGLW